MVYVFLYIYDMVIGYPYCSTQFQKSINAFQIFQVLLKDQFRSNKIDVMT